MSYKGRNRKIGQYLLELWAYKRKIVTIANLITFNLIWSWRYWSRAMKLAHDKVPHLQFKFRFFIPFLTKRGLSPLALGESGVFPFCNQRKALPGEYPISSLKNWLTMTSYLRGLVVSVPSVPTSKAKGRWLAAGQPKPWSVLTRIHFLSSIWPAGNCREG